MSHSRKTWLAAIFTFVTLHGMLMQIRGAILPKVQEFFTVSQSLLGLVSPAATVGFLISTLVIGLSAGRINIKKFFMGGLLTLTIATFLVGLASNYFLFLFLLLITGLSTGIFRALDKPVLSHMYPENRGWLFSVHTAVWAIGATLGPLFVNRVLNFGDWRLTYLIISFTFIPVFWVIWRNDPPQKIYKEKALSREKLKTILKDPVMLIIFGGLVLNGGIEGGFFAWLPYFINESFPHYIANMSLSGFLITYIPGRFLFGWLSKKIDYINLTVILSLSSFLLIFYTFFFASGYIMLICIAGIGFLASGIFPIMLAMAVDRYPDYSGPINGVTTAFQLSGLTFYPVLMGIIGDNFSTLTAMRLLILNMGGVALINIVLKKYFFK